jgi:exodeoxyribonuclease V alpha subunit
MYCWTLTRFDGHELQELIERTIGMPRRIGASVLGYYRDQAQERIEANPYVLLSFEADWPTVDGLARKRLGLAENDPRRLHAGMCMSTPPLALFRGCRS